MYSNSLVSAGASYWVKGPTIRFSSCGGTRIAYAHTPDASGGLHTLDSLPIEFFNHELMGVDADDESQVFDFVKEWGFPFSPFRTNEKTIEQLANLIDFDTHANAIGASENALNNAIYANCDDLPGVSVVGRDVISFEEAKATIAELQNCVTMLYAILENEGRDLMMSVKAKLMLGVVNACSNNPIRIGSIQVIGSDLDRTTGQITLTNAICNQIIDVVSDPAPWRLCANQNGRKPCGRIFKHKRTESKTPDVDARFCCKKCSDADKQRRKRAKDKANPAQ